MTLYDKDGKAYEVKHMVDVKEWLASGLYFEYSPEASNKDDLKILKLIENIDTQKEKGLKILATHFGIEFVSIEETLPLIKEEIEKGK